MIIKEFHFEKLYHTTTIYNSKSEKYLKEVANETQSGFFPKYEFPKFGEFHTKLDIPKWFTVSSKDAWSYVSPWLGHNEIILEYNVKKPLKLLDIRNEEKYGRGKYLKYIFDNEFIDGYIGTEDVIEIYLKKPNICLDENHKIIHIT